MFLVQETPKAALPTAAVTYKCQNCHFTYGAVLLTSELARGSELDPQKPPLQDPVQAALCERAGRLQHRENCVVNLIEQQFQAWERETLAQSLVLRQTEVTCFTPE